MSLKFMKLGNDILFVYDNRPTAGSRVLPFFLMTIAKVFIFRIKQDQKLDFIDLTTIRKQKWCNYQKCAYRVGKQEGRTGEGKDHNVS